MENWYYQIELPDGTFTNGKPHLNLALWRPFFQRVKKTGLRCLDIGTQEFVAPILMQRQGAGEIVACDFLNLEARREVITESYGVKFHYAPSLPLLGVKKSLRDNHIGTVFDFVNFCGVLYHLPDPITGLAIARSFLREGGIMLLETSFALDPGYVARVNHAGQLYPGSNYFQVSLEALDYWVRLLRMRILDAAFIGGRNDIGRVVAVCRAVDRPLAESGDTWMEKGFIERDLAPFGLDFQELISAEPPVVYRDAESQNVMRAELDSVNLYQTFQRNGVTKVDRDLCALRLKDAA